MDLTERERKVLELAAAGKQSKQIAHEMDLHISEVYFRRCIIADKLGARDVKQWKRVAVEKGLLPA